MEEISVSFNGGKDCTVLLCLILLYLQERGRKEEKELDQLEKELEQRQHTQNAQKGELARLKIFYLHYSDTFPEMDQFTTDIISK